MTIFAKNQATPPARTKSRIQRLFTAALLTLSLCTGFAQADTNRILRMNVDYDQINFNPTTSLDVFSDSINKNLYEPLIRQAQDGSFVAGLAKAWEVSEDRTTYRFHIREDSSWSDGTAITAQSVAEGLRFLKELERLPRDSNGNMPEIALDAAGWVTLRFPLPHYGALSDLSYHNTAPPPIHVMDTTQYEGDWLSAPPANMVYSGPYRVTAAEEALLSIRPNEGYYDRDSLKNGGFDIPLELKSIPEMFGQFRLEETDLVVMNTAIQSQALASLDPNEFELLDSNSINFVVFNISTPPLDDLRVRKALTLAAQLSTSSTFEQSYFHHPLPFFVLESFGPAFEIAPPDWTGWAMEKRLEEARQLMAEMGYSAENPLRLTLNASVLEGDLVQIDRMLKSQWNQIFVETEVVRREFDAHLDALINRNYQASIIGWTFSEPSPFSLYETFRSDSPYNVGGYSNETFDQLINSWLTTDDQEELNNLSIEIQKLLHRDMPALPLLTGKNLLLKQIGLQISPNGERFDFDLRHIGYVEDTRG